MNARKTMYELFYECANKNLENLALVYKFKKFSYKHVLNRVNSLAKALINLGYKKDDVITVMLPNVPYSIYLLYAINQIGAIANLIHPLMKKEQLLEIMQKTNSKVLFLLDSNVSSFLDFHYQGIKLYLVSPVDELNFIYRFIYNRKLVDTFNLQYINNLINDKDANYIDCDHDYKKDSIYLHSGGTTGKPKTIALSNFAVNSLSVQGLDLVCQKDGHNSGMLSCLPVFHGFGLVMGIHVSLINEGFNCIIPKFTTKETIKLLKKGYLQTLIGVPILYEALLRNKKFKGKILKNLNNAFVGGDFVSESLKYRFNERMIEAGARARLYEGYGLTETVTVCAVNTHHYHKDQTVGRAIDNVEFKIFDPDTKEEITNGENGEIYVSGDTLMNGYRFESEKTDVYYVDKNNKTWIKTGDFGHLDSDGYLYFVQRLKRLIKVSGINVFPSAIENELMTLNFIFECHVKGIKDEKRGNMIKLYVVVDNKFKGNSFNDEINDLIIKKFGIYALPKEIIYLDKLPKTLIGKVDESKLKE